MKLKYYLRGLGIGMFFTALILVASFSQRKPMTDEEVIARAKELGMIENTVLKERDETTSDETTSDEPAVDQEPTDDEANEDEEPADQEPTNQETPEESADEEPVADVPVTNETEPDAGNAQTNTGETVTLTVQRGDSSVSVSRRAEEAGLVNSAADFDSFLCANGYDKSISVGTYEITLGATQEEIAKIITKTN